jgi:hypothetical protein
MARKTASSGPSTADVSAVEDVEMQEQEEEEDEDEQINGGINISVSGSRRQEPW